MATDWVNLVSVTRAKRRRHLSVFENSLLSSSVSPVKGLWYLPRAFFHGQIFFPSRRRRKPVLHGGSSSVLEAINLARLECPVFTRLSCTLCMQLHTRQIKFFYTPRAILHSTIVNFLRSFSLSLSQALRFLQLGLGSAKCCTKTLFSEKFYKLNETRIHYDMIVS